MTAGSAVLEGGAPIDYAYDPDAISRAGQLPEAAARLYADLCDEAEDAGAIASAANDRVQEERSEVYRIRGEIADFERHPNWRADDKLYVALKGQRDGRRKVYQDAQDRAALKGEGAASLVATRTTIDRWLKANAGRVIVPHETPAPKLARGEAPVAAVERIRASIAAMQRDPRTAAGAPLPAAEAKAAARDFVGATAALARPDVSPLFQGGESPHFAAIPEVYMQPLYMPEQGVIAVGGPVRDGLALACWLHPDAVIAALHRDIDARADDKRALTVEAKAATIADLDARTLDAEREEEAFLRMALDQGAVISRRGDADPRAVLQVAVA